MSFRLFSLKKVKHQFAYISYTACLFFIFAGPLKANISATLSNNETVNLIGIGMYQELRNDIYVGALFGPSSITEVEQLLDESVAKRMSIRFLTSYSNRKLARHWKERMAMNNPRSSWQPLTQQIVGFSKIFKRPVELNDELNIDYIPGVGTQVYLNSTLFMTIDNHDFAELLLNVWLGNIPPTKAFKNSIRGLDDASIKGSYIARYEGLSPAKGRFDSDLNDSTQVAIAEDNPAENTTNPATKVAQNTATKPQEDKQSANKPETKPNAKKVAKVDEKKTGNNQSQNSTSKAATDNKKVAANKPDSTTLTKPDTTPEIKTEIKPDIPADIKLDPNLVKVADKAETKPAEKKPETKKIAKKIEPVIDENFFDADLVTGSYTRDLINEIKKHQEYPRKALIDRKQGDVTAQVTIDKDGEILDIELIERSGSRVLDRAVSRIIRKAGPFQKVPVELKLEQFVFDVPISFKL
ncbi:TonB family protein [Aliikangiella maris]|uniref:TonB family protein n=2 Tax=Aliikangiella maris TaxID=3162458 RepID=A0ABV3MKA5_9GAMM